MPVTHDRITVHPPAGQALSVEILDPATGATVTAFTTQNGDGTSGQASWPTTTTGDTDFWVPAGSGPYNVSAKLNGVEIAAAGGTVARNVHPGTTVTPVFDSARLLDVIAAAAPSGGSTPVLYAEGRIEVPGAEIGAHDTIPCLADGAWVTVTDGAPHTLGAGDAFIFDVVVPSFTVGSIDVTNFELLVSNAAGTEKLIRDALTAPSLASGTVWHPDDSDSFQEVIVGSDLSIDASGHIVSAAGGEFFASMMIKLTASADLAA